MSVVMSPPRRDKKKEIKATLPRSTRSVIEQQASAVGLSPMAYAARLTEAALHNEKVVRAFAPYFKRGYVPLYSTDSVLIGRVIAPSLDALLPEGEDVTRFPVKFLADEHLKVGELAFAFASSLSQTLTVILNEALLQGVTI